MTTTEDPIRLLFCSDLHFGIQSVNQEEMANAFADTIFPLLSETDIFCINGDFFDTLVIFDNHGFDPIYEVILGIFKLCEQHKVTLRILQGTWTHDRNQLKRFEAFYRNGYYTFDFKFMEGISFETITIRDRELRFMHVQDNLPYTCSDDIVEVINNKRYELGWDTIDYACMHGFFEFTFPQNVSQLNQVVFRKDQFPFINKLIDVGHVHQYREDGFIYSNGSFDRFVFGDEDAKGCIRALDYKDHYTAQFIQNKDAAIYDTLHIPEDATTEDISGLITDHLTKVKSIRKISLRFVTFHTEQYEAIKAFMREHHPDVKVFRKKITDDDGQKLMLPISDLIEKTEKRIAPTRATIAVFIRNDISEDYALTVDEIEAYLETT